MSEVLSFTQKSGLFAAGIWFILVGLTSMTNIRFELQGVVYGLLAVWAGACLSFGK